MQPPECPECGRPMLDDSDGITGGWFCAYNHRAVVMDLPNSERDVDSELDEALEELEEIATCLELGKEYGDIDAIARHNIYREICDLFARQQDWLDGYKAQKICRKCGGPAVPLAEVRKMMIEALMGIQEPYLIEDAAAITNAILREHGYGETDDGTD